MIDVEKIIFEKLNGLVPAVIVDKNTDQVIMLGFMNKEALEETEVDAVAAANFFQYTDQSVFLARKYLYDQKINVRKPKLK